ncbi:MAG: cupredoxin domain-containing protein, partial [Fimbriimonadaceae bacterium]|nr:cupredoxin domain-containing protein [Fimbriimonadaceae bacterium]
YHQRRSTLKMSSTMGAGHTIDGGKYTPNVVTVERGKPVELTFTGGPELGCGGTVVFKSLNQSKEVESGKSVTFAFTPDKAGEIPFTCGMDMYDGKVVVK